MSKIAFLTTNDGHQWGGSEELWSLCALYLAKKGHQIGVSVRKWDTTIERIAEIEKAGGKIYYRQLGAAGILNKIKKRIQPYQYKAAQMSKMQAWLDEFKPDLMVISLGHNFQGKDWMRACINRNIPYSLLVQLASEYKWPNDNEVQPFIDGYSQAKKCFFVSQKNKRLTELQIGLNLNNTEIVRNPFNVPYNPQLSWPSTENGYKLATVASLSMYHKGHDVILEVLSQKKWKERPISLSLVGNGPHEENLKRIIKMNQISNVSFYGYTPSVLDVWASHHALIMGSRIEGLPLALVEGMLCDRLAIVPDVAGNAELMVDGKTGFLAKAPTVELMDEALENAWKNRDNWQTLGKNAGEMAREKIPPNPVELFADKLLKILL